MDEEIPIAFLERRIVIGTIVLILSIFGMMANVLIAFSKTAPNKRLMGSLVLASTVFLIPEFVVFVPCSFSYCPYYDSTLLNFLSTPDTIGYYVYQMSLVHILIDRFLFFYAPRASKVAQRYELYFAILIWLFVITLTVTEWFFNCRKTFDPYTLNLMFDVLPEGEPFLKIHKYIANGAPIILVFISIIVFARIRIVHYSMSSNRLNEEISLMFQYSFICAFSWFGSFCFYFLPELKELFNSRLTLLPPVTSIISLTCHSYIFIFTHKKIRREIFRYFCAKRLHRSISTSPDPKTTCTTQTIHHIIMLE